MSLLASDVGGNVNSFPPVNLSASLSVTSLSGQASGNGTYVTSSSSGNAYSAFSGSGYWVSTGGQYSTGSGAYGGSFVTTDVASTSYSGEWLQIQLPYAIIPSAYSLTSSVFGGKTPSTFVLLGSSDSATWYTVDSRTSGVASEASWTGGLAVSLSTYSKAHSIFRLVITASWKAVDVAVNSLVLSGSINPIVQNTPNVPSSGPISFSAIKAAYGSAFGSNFGGYSGGIGSNFAAFRGKTAQSPVVGSNLLASVTTPISGTNAIVARGGTVVGTAGASSTISINLQNYASAADGTLTCALRSSTGPASTVSVTGSSLTLGSTSPGSGTAVVSLTNKFGNVQYVTIPYNFLPSPPSSAGLIAMYTGESYTNGIWADITGNGNHATVSGGNVTVVNAGLNGTRSYLKGTSATTVSFPSAILPSTYTLMHVARYEPTGNTFGNILEGATSNAGFLSGFWNGLTGCAYHNGTIGTSTGLPLSDWAYTTAGSNYGSNWLLSVDTNTTFRANGITVGTTGAGAPSYANLSINSYQPSDFDIGCIAVYNTAISVGNAPSYEYWMGSNYGIPIATVSSTPSVSLSTSAGSTSNVNLAAMASNCSSYTIVVNPNGANVLSLAGASLSIVGSLQNSVTYTVILRGISSNGSYTFIPISVSETASTPTPIWTTSAAYGWNASSNAFVINETTGVNQPLATLCTVTGGTPTFSIVTNPLANASIVGGSLITSGGYRNTTYSIVVSASFTLNGNTATSTTTFLIVEGGITSVTLSAPNLSYTGLSNVAVVDNIYVSAPSSAYLTGATYAYNVTGQTGSWTNSFNGILSIGGTNGQLTITPGYRGNGSTTYTANVTASVILNGSTANGSISIPVTEATLPAPVWYATTFSYTSIVGTGPLGNSTWTVQMNNALYCTASVGTLSFQVTSVSPSQAITPYALSGLNNSTLTVTGLYRGTTAYTINVLATATYGSLTATASAGFVIQEGNVPAPVWTLASSINQNSLGTGNGAYSSIVNLAVYCTPATTFYITTNPYNNVVLSSSTLQGYLNKPSQSYTIGLSASNIGTYSATGSAVNLTINESPYANSSPTTGQTINGSTFTLTNTFFQGSGLTYGYTNTNTCPDSSINASTGTFTVTNNYRNATYNFVLSATAANGLTAYTTSFSVTEPIAPTPVWSGTLPSSFSQYSSGSANSTYNNTIVNLSSYCTNATNYYITSAPASYVSFNTSSSVATITYAATTNIYSTLNKPGVVSSITVAASNILTYSQTGAAVTFSIKESPYCSGTPTAQTAPTSLPASSYFQGTATYTANNQSSCPDFSFTSPTMTVTNTYQNASYTFSLSATANGLTVSTGNFFVTEPALTAWTLSTAQSTYTGLTNVAQTTGAISVSPAYGTPTYSITSGTGSGYASGLNTTTGAFTYTPSYRSATYTVVVTATGTYKGSSVSGTLTYSFAESIATPVLSAVPSTQYLGGTAAVALSFSATNATSYWVNSGAANSTAITSGSSFNLTPAYRSASSPYTVTVGASNTANGLTSSATATFQVYEAPNVLSGLSVTSGLVGAFFGESYLGGVWIDGTGSNNTPTIGGTGIGVTTNGLNGLKYVSGTTATTVLWPNAITSGYTLHYVARYDPSATSGRIFTGYTTNWLSGFWQGRTGVAYHQNWITQYAYDWADSFGNTSVVSQPSTKWLLGTDQNLMYRANGCTLYNGANGISPDRLCINFSGENSPWNVAGVLAFNRELSATDYKSVEAWLASKYNLVLDTSTIATQTLNLTTPNLTNFDLSPYFANCTSFAITTNGTPNAGGAAGSYAPSLSGSLLTVTGYFGSRYNYNWPSTNYSLVVTGYGSGSGSVALQTINIVETPPTLSGAVLNTTMTVLGTQVRTLTFANTVQIQVTGGNGNLYFNNASGTTILTGSIASPISTASLYVAPGNYGQTYNVTVYAYGSTTVSNYFTVQEYPSAISFATVPATQTLSGSTTTGNLTFSLNGGYSGGTITYTVTGTGVNYTANNTYFTITPANRGTTYTVTIIAYNTATNGLQTTASTNVTVNEYASAISFATVPATQYMNANSGTLSFSLNGGYSGGTINYYVTGTDVSYSSGTSFSINPTNPGTSQTVKISASNIAANGYSTGTYANVTVYEAPTWNTIPTVYLNSLGRTTAVPYVNLVLLSSYSVGTVSSYSINSCTSGSPNGSAYVGINGNYLTCLRNNPGGTSSVTVTATYNGASSSKTFSIIEGGFYHVWGTLQAYYDGYYQYGCYGSRHNQYTTTLEVIANTSWQDAINLFIATASNDLTGANNTHLNSYSYSSNYDLVYTAEHSENLFAKNF